MKKQTGFTIVELLIVIVVIGILAAISIVSYTGIQARAQYSTMQSDIKSINTAVKLYHVDHGHYPYYGTSWGARSNSDINSLLQDYIKGGVPVPQAPNSYYAYIWSENGADYKIVRLVNNVGQLPAIEESHPNQDPRRAGRGWGFWSENGVNL